MDVPDTMKAALFRGKCNVLVEEVPVPVVPPGFLLLQREASGICGSDLHQYFERWGQPENASGHEFSGTVVRVGEGVTRFSVGDRLCAECFSHCGTCTWCRTGQYNLCDNRRYLPQDGHAGFADYPLIHESSAFRLPDSLSFEQGALVEPLAVSYRAVIRARVKPGDSLVVIGGGTIGLGCVAVASTRGLTPSATNAEFGLRNAESTAKTSRSLHPLSL